MPSLDPQLIGWWEQLSFEMAPVRTLAVLGGTHDGKVCFSDSGHYRTAPHYDDIKAYSCVAGHPYSELDVWIRGHKSRIRCIYTIENDVLRITVAGCPLGVDSLSIKRPTAMRMDANENWVLITMQRASPPKKRAKSTPKHAARQLLDAKLIRAKKLKPSLVAFLSGEGEAPDSPATDWLPFCTLKIATGSLWVGDPHLANAEDGHVVEAPAGQYIVEAVGVEFDGTRVVSRLRVRLECVDNPTLGKELGVTGTDSAMIGVCDIEAFDKACAQDSGLEVQESIESQTGDGFGIISIDQCPGAAMPFVPVGSDGSGPVFVLMSDGKCVGVELRFLDEDGKA